MSVLEAIQHTPERLHALAQLLKVAGPIGREDLQDLMLAHQQPAERTAEAVKQAIAAAASLELVRSDRDLIALPDSFDPPTTFLAFSDTCYDRFLSATAPDNNAIILDAFALIADDCNRRQNLLWLFEIDREAFVGDIEGRLNTNSSEKRTFNTTRITPWRRWLIALGLAIEIPQSLFYPDITRRLIREIDRDPGLALRTPIEATDFLTWVRQKLPFLPGGERCRALGITAESPRTADFLLSSAMWNLQEEGRLSLTRASDDPSAVELRHDRSGAYRFISTVTINRMEAAV